MRGFGRKASASFATCVHVEPSRWLRRRGRAEAFALVGGWAILRLNIGQEGDMDILGQGCSPRRATAPLGLDSARPVATKDCLLEAGRPGRIFENAKTYFRTE